MKILTLTATVSILTFFALFSGLDFDANTDYSKSMEKSVTESHNAAQESNSNLLIDNQDVKDSTYSIGSDITETKKSNIEKHLNVRHLSNEDFKAFGVEIMEDNISLKYKRFYGEESISEKCIVSILPDSSNLKINITNNIIANDTAIKEINPHYPVAFYGVLKDKKGKVIDSKYFRTGKNALIEDDSYVEFHEEVQKFIEYLKETGQDISEKLYISYDKDDFPLVYQSIFFPYDLSIDDKYSLSGYIIYPANPGMHYKLQQYQTLEQMQGTHWHYMISRTSHRIQDGSKALEAKRFDIAAIEYLELTDKELENIGIFKMDSVYKFTNKNYYDLNNIWERVHKDYIRKDSLGNYIGYAPYAKKDYDFSKTIFELGYDTLQRKGYYYQDFVLDSHHILPHSIISYDADINFNESFNPVAFYQIWNQHYTGDILKKLLTLRFISNEVLDEDNIYHKDLSRDNISTYQLIVPVRISFSPENTNKLCRWSDYEIYYPLSSEFISKLPDRYRIPLEKEYELIQKVFRGEISYLEACKGLNNERSMLGICRSETENLQIINLYPNPILNHETTIEFILTKDSDLRIDMHDLNGSYLSSLMESTKLSEGIHKFSINIPDDTKEGLYFITLSIDHGDQVVQKILVK